MASCNYLPGEGPGDPGASRRPRANQGVPVQTASRHRKINVPFRSASLSIVIGKQRGRGGGGAFAYVTRNFSDAVFPFFLPELTGPESFGMRLLQPVFAFMGRDYFRSFIVCIKLSGVRPFVVYAHLESIPNFKYTVLFLCRL